MVTHSIFRCKFITYFPYYLIMRALNLQFKQIIYYFAANMKYPFYISLLLSCCIGVAACTGPVIIEEPKNEQKETEQTNNTQHTRDSVPIIHRGTYTSPYTIGETQTLGKGKGAWIEGYIVGSVSGSMKSGCNYTPKAMTKSNILLADTFPTGKDYDYLYCLPIKLPDNSTERDDLNLYDNPDNYHRKIRIEGDITLYFKVIGVEEISDYIFVDQEIGKDTEDDTSEGKDPEVLPDTPNEPDATRQDTLSIAEGIKLQSEEHYNQVNIKGYIIGYTTSNRKIYYDLIDIKEASARSNVVLADNIEERNCDNMIAVELKNDSYIQQSVNLFDNPQNLHKLLTVKGVMKPYKSLKGCIDIPNGYKDPLCPTGSIIKDYYFLIE